MQAPVGIAQGGVGVRGAREQQQQQHSRDAHRWRELAMVHPVLLQQRHRLRGNVPRLAKQLQHTAAGQSVPL